MRTGDPRTDFFTVYRKQADEFDKDYVQKYDEDLNTTLIFVSGAIRIYMVNAHSGWLTRPDCSPQSAPPS